MPFSKGPLTCLQQVRNLGFASEGFTALRALLARHQKLLQDHAQTTPLARVPLVAGLCGRRTGLGLFLLACAG